jgi:hypothetical protein
MHEKEENFLFGTLNFYIFYVNFHDFILINFCGRTLNFCGIMNSFLCFNDILPKFLEFFDKKWKKSLVEERKFFVAEQFFQTSQLNEYDGNFMILALNLAFSWHYFLCNELFRVPVELSIFQHFHVFKTGNFHL